MSGKTKTVILSGSTGLIGAAVRERLAASCRVLTAGRRPEQEIRVDFSSPAGMGTLPLAGAEAFVHCAGIVDGDISANPLGAFMQSTVALSSLLERCETEGVRRFVYISTSHVYGPPSGLTTETSPVNPMGLYAGLHYLAEQAVKRQVRAGGMKALILRPNAVFGVPQCLDAFDRWSLIPYAFPREAVVRQRIVLRSSGAQKRNFISTCDIAEHADAFCGEAEPVSWRILNPLGRTTMTVHEFAQLCARCYERVTGTTCEVVRPKDACKESGSDFVYASGYSDEVGSSVLDECIEALIRILVEKKKEGLLNGM